MNNSLSNHEVLLKHMEKLWKKKPILCLDLMNNSGFEFLDDRFQFNFLFPIDYRIRLHADSSDSDEEVEGDGDSLSFAGHSDKDFALYRHVRSVQQMLRHVLLSSDEDVRTALLAELERMKKESDEKVLQKKQQEREKRLQREEELKMKRRLDDETKSPKRRLKRHKQRFVNDTASKDFGSKFLQKYMEPNNVNRNPQDIPGIERLSL